MEHLKISAGGQILVPTAVRRRWKTEVVVAEDHGDHLVLRPASDDPITRAWGAFKGSPGPSTDEMTRMNREEEQEIEERKYGPDPG
jgi:bifunctional DNA-binding transcriptional regulator/antitoxin component of YhaV-PrlF toxin-antitoxin module